ncbi:MAG: DNA polymerase IV [Patulibacter sp.]
MGPDSAICSQHPHEASACGPVGVPELPAPHHGPLPHRAESGGALRRVIAHCDIDAFYASVELRRRPELRGRPLIVGGLGPRAVVTTASYEARAFGVGSAMPMSRARRLCPQAVVLPPDMAVYRARSAEVWGIVRDRFAVVQQAGIDEAYVDLSTLDRPLSALREMVAAVEQATGLVVSVGVGPNRLIAKTTSGAVKPRGFAVLSREQACAHFAQAPVRTLQGVGPRTAQRLAQLGVGTIEQLRAQAPGRLAAEFGCGASERLGALARFVDDSPVQPSRPIKSCSRETTFPEDLDDPGALLAALARLTERLADDLAHKELAGRTIGIKLRLADWSTRTRARTLPAPVRDAAAIQAIARELLAGEGATGPVRMIGVRCAGFADATRQPAPTRNGAVAAQLELPFAVLAGGVARRADVQRQRRRRQPPPRS